jgi:hypothetical protein
MLAQHLVFDLGLVRSQKEIRTGDEQRRRDDRRVGCSNPLSVNAWSLLASLTTATSRHAR